MDKALIGLIAPPANPGLVAIGSSGGSNPVGATDFTNLLGGFQSFPGGSDMVSLGGSSMEMAGLSSLVEQSTPTEMEIPNDLAMMLGLVGNNFISSVGQAQDNADGMVKLPVSLVSVETDGKPELFLKIATSDQFQGFEGATGQKESDEDGMLLPMRLRTVEQSGGQLLADAELRTATGKAITIRLKLEIVGSNPEVNQLMDGKGSKAKPEANLLRNLGELNVQLISIEPADEVKKSAVAHLIPTSDKGKGNMVSKSSNGRLSDMTGVTSGSKSTLTTTVLEAIEADPEVTVSKGDGHGALSTKSDGSFDRFFPVNTGTKIGLDLPTVIPAGETTGEAIVSEKSDLPSVRYIELDKKLDMLKANPGQKIKIQMTPARLGPMELTIVNHRGQVTVNLTLSSLTAKAAVERNLAQLESQLASSGIKVDQFQIHVNQSSRSQSGGFYHPGQNRQEGQTGHKENRTNQSFMERFQKRYGGDDVSFDRVMINCLA